MNPLAGLLLVLVSVVVFCAEKTAPFIDIQHNARWSYSLNGEATNIRVADDDTIINGKRCNKIEWRGYDARLPAYKTEYWYVNGDSIFCAVIKLYGNTSVYTPPFLVIAGTTKPGDYWMIKNGKKAFAETITCRSEGYDSIYLTQGNRMVSALKISRKGRGPTQYYWFSREHGIVMEESRME